ncbi:MAG: protease inhibitor I42 family protein [Proteobacteria bacterium]|nr:protease inhibitor I42 family protein [Pseudomonadota bacterium]
MFSKSVIIPAFMSIALLFSATSCHILTGEDVDEPEETVQPASAPLAAPPNKVNPPAEESVVAEEEEELQAPDALKMKKPKKIKINGYDGYLSYEKTLFSVELTEKPSNAIWKYAAENPTPLVETTNEYYAIKPNEKRGIAGKKVFAFRTLKEGTAKINFGYVRDEQKISEASMHFSLIVHIDEDGLIYRVEQRQ